LLLKALKGNEVVVVLQTDEKKKSQRAGKNSAEPGDPPKYHKADKARQCRKLLQLNEQKAGLIDHDRRQKDESSDYITARR